MKNERNFLKQLDSSINKMELLKYFSDNKNLRAELFKQYTATEPQPNLSLYFRKYFSEKEWSKAITENNMNIPLKDSQITTADLMPVTDFDIETDRIIKEFNRLLLEEKLPEKYYRHSIEGTEIYRILTLVSLAIEDFQKSVIDPDDFDFKVLAEAFAIGLINRIEEIHISELTTSILKDFVSDNGNVQIDAVYIVSGILRQRGTIPEDEIRSHYSELKMYADNVINEYLEKLDENQPQPNLPKKTLKNFFTDEVNTDIIETIQDDFKDYEGKRLAMLLHRLVDLKWVSYLPHSKTESRKHFVELLKNEKCNLSYVNRILSDANELKKHSTDDPDYIDIKKKIAKALKKEVV